MFNVNIHIVSLDIKWTDHEIMKENLSAFIKMNRIIPTITTYTTASLSHLLILSLYVGSVLQKEADDIYMSFI